MAGSELKTRVITGVIFGVVLIGGILLSEYLLTGIALFILIWGLKELRSIVRVNEIHLPFFTLLAGNIIIFASVLGFTLAHVSLGIQKSDLVPSFITAVLLVFVIFSTELFRAKTKALESISITIFSFFYLALPSGLLVSASVTDSGNYEPWRILFFFFMMWASDTGAYFTGRFFGKHKLFERLSPKKTIEGFLGGVITAMLTGFAASLYFEGSSTLFWVLTGAIMSITGSLGDLFESMIKRQFEVKDSGTLLPGHGGILDRFDSTFLSIPIYFLLLKFLLFP
ncbi:MAG: phosphatidate cytidylyltransferase [Bacteroidia bacterium]